MTETFVRAPSPKGTREGTTNIVKKRRPLHKNVPAVILGCAGVVVAFLLLWEWAVAAGMADSVLVGRPSQIATSLRVLVLEKGILGDALATFIGTTVGWVLASIAAIVVAFALASVPYLRAIFDPIFVALNSLPRIALAPIFLLWFGIGMESKIALSASLAFFVVLANTWAGIDSVDDDTLLLSRVLGATRWQRSVKFVIPSAVPGIFTGLELGFIFGMLATIGGEMISGQNGLGVRLQYFAASFQTNDYFATLLVLVVMATFITWGLRRVRVRLLRWQGSQLGRGDEG
jgi:NitT/TauT family transport system permease protein